MVLCFLVLDATRISLICRIASRRQYDILSHPLGRPKSFGFCLLLVTKLFRLMRKKIRKKLLFYLGAVDEVRHARGGRGSEKVGRFVTEGRGPRACDVTL